MNIYLQKAIQDIHDFEHENYDQQRNVSEQSKNKQKYLKDKIQNKEIYLFSEE